MTPAYDMEGPIIQRDMAARLMATLTPRERHVIALRFGFVGGGHTLKECGAVLSRSNERIRQIEAKALRKMRHRVAEEEAQNPDWRARLADVRARAQARAERKREQEQQIASQFLARRELPPPWRPRAYFEEERREQEVLAENRRIEMEHERAQQIQRNIDNVARIWQGPTLCHASGLIYMTPQDWVNRTNGIPWRPHG